MRRRAFTDLTWVGGEQQRQFEILSTSNPAMEGSFRSNGGHRSCLGLSDYSRAFCIHITTEVDGLLEKKHEAYGHMHIAVFPNVSLETEHSRGDNMMTQMHVLMYSTPISEESSGRLMALKRLIIGIWTRQMSYSIVSIILRSAMTACHAIRFDRPLICIILSGLPTRLLTISTWSRYGGSLDCFSCARRPAPW